MRSARVAFVLAVVLGLIPVPGAADSSNGDHLQGGANEIAIPWAADLAAEAYDPPRPMRHVESWAAMQNLSLDQTTRMSAEFFLDGGGSERVRGFEAPPGRAAYYFTPDMHLQGGLYSVLIQADGPVAAVTSTGWPLGGGNVMSNSPQTGTQVILPVAVRRFHGASSLVSIQNVDRAETARVTASTVDYGTGIRADVLDSMVRPGHSIRLDFDADLAVLGDGFLGALAIEASGPVAAETFVDIGGRRRSVYGFSAVPVESAAEELYIPLFRAWQFKDSRAAASGRIDTGVGIFNPGDVLVVASITYYGAGGACAGLDFAGLPVVLQPMTGHVVYQGDPAMEGLPRNCYGSAVVRADGPVIAMVNEATDEGVTAAALAAASADDVATSVSIPLWRKEHSGGASTGIAVMNVGDAPAEVVIRFSRALPAGTEREEPVVCESDCRAVISPKHMHAFWPPAMDSLTSGTYGSAMVESTEPVAVVVNETPVLGSVDMATYNGLAMASAASP